MDFGNPRPVNSWANSNVSNRIDPTWEQVVAPTLLLQHQMQEVRGEIKATQNDIRPNGVSSRHSIRDRSNANGSNNSAQNMKSRQIKIPLEQDLSSKQINKLSQA